MSIHINERPLVFTAREAVPWATVLPLAVAMAFADGFWMTSLRAAFGAIERSQGLFVSWLRESTLILPLFVVAVLATLTLALRKFGPGVRNGRTALVTALMMAAAGALVGVIEIVVSSLYDFHLQSQQLTLMAGMHGDCDASCLAALQDATFGVQVKAVLIGAALLLATNLLVVGWVVALYGGRITVSKPARRSAASIAIPDLGGRRQEMRLLLVALLLGAAVIHAAVIPEHLSEWAAAGQFFILLTAAEVGVAFMLFKGGQHTVALAAAVISVGPLLVWLYSRTIGLPFGPAAGVREAVGLPDVAAGLLELTSLLLVVALVRGVGSLRRPAASPHVRSLVLAAVVAVTLIGGAASLNWLDSGGTAGEPSMVMAE